MAKPRLETLKAINVEFFGSQWADNDLEQLVTPTFGVVASFESVVSNLRKIVARDLGDVAPHTLAQPPDSGND